MHAPSSPPPAANAASAGPRMLMPGEWHFGAAPGLLRTLLGSCVAVTLWHPARRIGGMCHFLLPCRRRPANMPLEGRFGDEALELLVHEQQRSGTRPPDYVAHLYGGADTMPESTGVKFNIGQRNIEAGWALIDKYGFMLEGVDVGDQVPRTVSLDLHSGTVAMQRGRGNVPGSPATRIPS